MNVFFKFDKNFRWWLMQLLTKNCWNKFKFRRKKLHGLGISVGLEIVGTMLGTAATGVIVGFRVGLDKVGIFEGLTVGKEISGELVGLETLGNFEGVSVGKKFGNFVGICEGKELDGDWEGFLDGLLVKGKNVGFALSESKI